MHSTHVLPPSLLAQLAALTPEQLATLTEAERAEIAAALDAHEAATQPRPAPAPVMSHREFAEAPDFCGLELSPMVAAIMDAAEGRRPTTITDAECEKYFGCPLDGLPTSRRRTIGIEAGGRGGKTSRLLATKALHAAWTVPLPTLAPNEHAVSLIVSSELVFARQALSFCGGYVLGSPVLSGAVVGDIGTDDLTLRRPDGKLVDVRVRAAGARGKGGRAFTLVSAFLDEACFFFDDSGVVNDREIYRACVQRVVPGGQVWLSSTPWIEGVGLLEEILAKAWGNHQRALAVRGVGTRVLNPSWDPTGEIEAELREDDPDNAEREIDAKPLTAGSRHFFSHDAIEALFDEKRPQRLPARPGALVAAGGDTGFVKNSSALAIVERLEVRPAVAGEVVPPPRFRLMLLEERKPQPGLPLQPKAVVGEFADLMLAYGTRELVADAHEIEEVAAALLAKNCTVVPAPEKVAAYVAARTIIHEGRLELPRHPRLRQQLRDVLSKPMPGGGVQITSPKRPDGSHGDLVSALINALWRASMPAPPPPPPPPPPVIPTPWAERHGF